MAEISKIDPKTSAVLTLDCQKGITGFVGTAAEKIFEPAAKVVKNARARNIRVIHVGIGFRRGYPEVSADHPTFSMLRQSGKFITGTESAEFHDSVAPEGDEITIV